jgi:hypothetical protein
MRAVSAGAIATIARCAITRTPSASTRTSPPAWVMRRTAR